MTDRDTWYCFSCWIFEQIIKEGVKSAVRLQSNNFIMISSLENESSDVVDTEMPVIFEDLAVLRELHHRLFVKMPWMTVTPSTWHQKGCDATSFSGDFEGSFAFNVYSMFTSMSLQLWAVLCIWKSVSLTLNSSLENPFEVTLLLVWGHRPPFIEAALTSLEIRAQFSCNVSVEADDVLQDSSSTRPLVQG